MPVGISLPVIRSKFIQNVNYEGYVLTIGSTGSTYAITSLIVDTNNNIYFTYGDSNGNPNINQIMKMDTNGNVSVYAGVAHYAQGTTGYSNTADTGVGSTFKFFNPQLVSIDPSGNLYVISGFDLTGARKVYKIQNDVSQSISNISNIIVKNSVSQEQIQSCVHDQDGNMYIGKVNNNGVTISNPTLLKLTTTGTKSTIYQYTFPSTYSTANIYATCDFSNNKIYTTVTITGINGSNVAYGVYNVNTNTHLLKYNDMSTDSLGYNGNRFIPTGNNRFYKGTITEGGGSASGTNLYAGANTVGDLDGQALVARFSILGLKYTRYVRGKYLFFVDTAAKKIKRLQLAP